MGSGKRNRRVEEGKPFPTRRFLCLKDAPHRNPLVSARRTLVSTFKTYLQYTPYTRQYTLYRLTELIL